MPLKLRRQRADIGTHGAETMTGLPGAHGAVGAESEMKRTMPSTRPESRALPVVSLFEVRRLINEGAYSTEPIADEVARRMLRSGDL